MIFAQHLGLKLCQKIQGILKEFLNEAISKLQQDLHIILSWEARPRTMNDKGLKLACEEAYTNIEVQLLEEARPVRAQRERDRERDRQARVIHQGGRRDHASMTASQTQSGPNDHRREMRALSVGATFDRTNPTNGDPGCSRHLSIIFPSSSG